MRNAFLVHVGEAMDAIKIQGHFKAYKEAYELYVEQLSLAKQLCALKLNNCLATEPQSKKDATKHAMQFLDTKCKKADLQSIIKENCKHLSADQQKKLLQRLKKYESLFDGTFGDWRTKPVSFQ